MPRPKEFDVDLALQRALEVFWQKGYEATSMQDLVDAMGIQRASLYGTFGDKRSLYLRALDSYQAKAFEEMRERLETATSPRDALVDLLLGAAGIACSRSGRKGCFCVNASVELGAEDRDIAGRMRAHGQAVEGLFAAALRRAVELHELPADTDPERLATFVFGLLIATTVLGKQRASRARLTALIAPGLAALGAEAPTG